MRAAYTVTYEPETIQGEHGYSYRVYTSRSHLVFEGWTRGKKHEAEIEVRHGIEAREALRSCAGIA